LGSAGFNDRDKLIPVSVFLEQHPKIEFELDLSDQYVDLVAEGFDLAVRIGEMRNSTLKAGRLAHLRRVVFAAPSYLAHQGHPKSPADLLRHTCIVRTAALDGNAWPFLIDGKSRKISHGLAFISESLHASASLGIVLRTLQGSRRQANLLRALPETLAEGMCEGGDFRITKPVRDFTY
jgi:DNA-binding transcriptional LysR family regulator